MRVAFAGVAALVRRASATAEPGPSVAARQGGGDLSQYRERPLEPAPRGPRPAPGRLVLRRALTLALVVAVTSPAAASPPPAAADTAARSAARAALRERLLRRIPQLAPDTVRAQETAFAFSELWRGGDLDGDGSDEIVDTRLVVEETADGEVTETVRMDVHRGRDGVLLWSTTLADTSFAFPVATKVGAQGGPGLVVAAYRVTFADAAAAFAIVQRTTVTAFDARGTAGWSHTFDGGYSGGPVSAIEATFFDGVLDTNPGGGSEALVTRMTGGLVDAVAGYASGSVGTAIVLDGATGDPRPLTPVPTLSPEPASTAAGDLDGDRRDDVVVVGNRGAANGATALSGADGRVLWTSADLPPSMLAYPTAVRDATGDGVADVTVATGFFAPPPTWGAVQDEVALVDGRNGAVRWVRPGVVGWSLGRDVDGRPGADLVVGEFVDDAAEWGVRFTAYDARGGQVWTAKRVVPADTSGGGQALFSAVMGMTGDTNGDRVLDAFYRVSVETRVERVTDGTVDGRTGLARRDRAAGMVPADLPIDGRGSDSFVVRGGSGRVDVSAWRGDTGQRLWQVTIPSSLQAYEGGLSVYADRDRCADVVVGATDDETTTDYVLSGATGRLLWALTRSGLGTPRVTRPATTGLKRFVRTC